VTLVIVNPHHHVATTQKLSILADLDTLQARIMKCLKGDTKFLDAHQKQVSAAIKKLTEAYGLLSTGLIPTNKE